jgi:hypothetical protein
MRGKFVLAQAVKDMFYACMEKLLVGGAIEIRSGELPPTPDATPLSGEILVRCPVVWDSNQQRPRAEGMPVISSGTPTWARAVDNLGNAIWDADVGAAGCTIVVDKNGTDLRRGEIFALQTITFFGL